MKIGQNLTRNPMVTSDLAYHVWFKSCASFNNKPNVSKHAYAILEQLLMFSKNPVFYARGGFMKYSMSDPNLNLNLKLN